MSALSRRDILTKLAPDRIDALASLQGIVPHGLQIAPI